MSEEREELFSISLDDDEIEGNEPTPSQQEPSNGQEENHRENEDFNESGTEEQNQPAPEDNPQDSTDEQIAAQYNTTVDIVKRAKSMGWSDKSKWKGKDSDFKGPKEFVDIADLSPAVLKERHDNMAAQLENIKKMFPVILEMQKRETQTRNAALEQEVKRLEKELENAKNLADAEAASQITEELMQTKIRQIMNAHDGKKLENNLQIDVTSNRDTAKEMAFRDSMIPRMSLSQRQKWNDAVAFLDSPINADQSTEQRIQYLKEVVFDLKPTQQPMKASPVGRPSGYSDPSYSPNSDSPTSVWDSMSKSDKEAALDLIENVSWVKNRASDPETYKKEFEKFKRSFQKYAN